MPVFIVAKPIADMNASGTGDVEKVQQTSHSTAGVQYEYRADVSIASDLFKAITWADANTEGAVDASSGVADFTIAIDEAAFAAALAGVIRTATGGKLAADSTYSTSSSANTAASVSTPSNLGAASATAQTVLDREVRLEVETILNQNNVLEYLEGDSLGQFELALDASGGAADMATKLAVDEDLRNFFLQIPNRTNVIGYDASEGTLPVMVGDTLGFVFDIDTSVVISETDTTAGAAATNGASNALGVQGTLVNPKTSATLTTENRRAIFIVTVSA